MTRIQSAGAAQAADCGLKVLRDPPPSKRPEVLRHARSVLLALLILVAAVLRLYDVSWDQFQQVHPDERFIVWVADTIAWPGSLAEALDPARSSLNPFRWPPADPAAASADALAGQPRNYAYGHFPLYLLVLTAHLAASGASWFGETTLAFPAVFQPLHTVGRHLASYYYLPLVGRVLSAVADLGTLLWVYLLARMLVGRGNGIRDAQHLQTSPIAADRNPADCGTLLLLQTVVPLLAAAAYAFAVLPIQISHFAAVDALLTFFVTGTVALAAYATRATRHARLTWLFAGVMAGLAIGSKFSAVLLFLPLLAAALFRLPPGPRVRQVAVVFGRLASAGGIAFLVFALTNPFALIEFGAFVRQIAAQNAMVSGIMDAPYTRQYINTLPYLYFVQQLSQWGLGWPLGLSAWGGLVWATIQFGRRQASPGLTVMLAWALPYFATTGAFHAKFLRYMAPLLPFLLVFGAGAALAAYRILARRWGRRGKIAWASLAALTLAFTVAWALTFLGVYRQEHPWIQASRWIYQNIPADSKLLTEHWDDALPLTLDELPGPRPPRRNYTRVELPMWEPDTTEKLDLLVAELSAADYIVLSSERLSAPLQRLRVRYPMTSQYYRLLFAGDLGYRPVAEFTAYPRLGSLVVRDGRADESFTVYDHPRVQVLQNVERLAPSLLRARLERYLPLGARAGERALIWPGIAGLEASAGVSGQRAQPANPEAGLRAALHPGKRVPGLARMSPQAPAPGAPLTLPQPVDTLPVVDDFRWNRVASNTAPIAVLLWWLALSLFGWLVWPLLYPLLGGLRDRGYGLARAAGWLLVGWLHWLGVSLAAWQNRLAPLSAILVGLAVLGLAAWVVQRRQIAAFWAERRRLILGQEALFAIAYLAFVGIRLLNPDLWQPWNGGEKFMEFAFLNAILRSPHFPPYDPYFAGGIINYYYYGLYLVSLPIKLTGIYPEVAFNLAVPGLFALTATGVFSVAYSLAGGSAAAPELQSGEARSAGRTALASVALALLMGNLSGLGWLVSAATAVVRGGMPPAYDYWGASRVIPYTINEFPLWTFTFADLHPHLIAMPFGMLVVGLALNWLLRRTDWNPGCPAASDAAGPQSGGLAARPWTRAPGVALLVVALGALGAINTWDLPTYALLVVGTLLVSGWRAQGWRAPVANIVLAAVIVALAVAAYWPFYANYQAQVGGVSGPVISRFLAWTRAASPLSDWLRIWGIFLFLSFSYAVAAWVVARKMDGIVRDRTNRDRRWLAMLLGLIAVLAILAAARRPTAAIAAVPLCLTLPLIFRRQAAPAEAFSALLLVAGLSIIAGVELVYLRDFLEGGEWYRMNTLFKFSIPAWLFLGVAGGPLLRRAWLVARRAPVWIAVPWQAAMGLLLVIGLVFLAIGVRARVDDRFPGARPAIGTLDATAYMTVGSYTWPSADHTIELRPEWEAIHWLLDNVRGTPVIAEAPAGGYDIAVQSGDATQPAGASRFVGYDYYRAGGLRAASLTGFPTFVGQHQGEQRPGDQVGPRTELGQEFFRTTDLARTRVLMAQLRVGYVYAGRLERILFSADALRKFDLLAELGELEVVYRNSDVTIYRVVG